MRTSISLIIVLILALFSLWLQEAFKDVPIIAPKKDKHFPDYFMENFSLTKMNTAGQPDYILQARKMKHFADDDSSELDYPVIEFKQDQGDWSVSANSAVFMRQENIILLYTNVRIRRAGSASNAPLSIDTGYLKIHTENQLAETDQLAHIKTGALALDTKGMVFDNRQGILKLLSDVRGIYDAPR
ncbi:MAG: LPS export ABC transporter periplasmic protein LptC [Gammaproteobacteria bacterium]|nr:LPS export ABC transporter periplasmic protein LptC [Gammaproteobacteria bacterium]